jgi:hypothetical protein
VVSSLLGSFLNSLAVGALTVWPLARILRRAGLSPWWSLLSFLPLVGLLAVAAVLALRPWPTMPPPPPPPLRKQRAI